MSGRVKARNWGANISSFLNIPVLMRRGHEHWGKYASSPFPGHWHPSHCRMTCILGSTGKMSLLGDILTRRWWEELLLTAEKAPYTPQHPAGGGQRMDQGSLPKHPQRSSHLRIRQGPPRGDSRAHWSRERVSVDQETIWWHARCTGALCFHNPFPQTISLDNLLNLSGASFFQGTGESEDRH